MKILFVCKHNRFRSKVAEGICWKLGKEKVEVKSAGLIKYIVDPYISKAVISSLDKKGYRIVDEASQCVNRQMIDWADKIVIVADNVLNDGFPEEKIERWEIEDCDESEIEKIKKTINKIERRVKKMLERVKV